MEDSPLVLLPEGYQLQTFFRVASISVAIYDYLETFPTAWRFYKEQLRLRRLTASATLFILLQFSSVIVLTLSNTGFFYNYFDQRLCERFFLLPPIFKVLQTMISQAILGFRVYNLSKRSDSILYAGLVVYVVTCSLQWVSTLLEREALVDDKIHNCRAFNKQGALSAWTFYALAMTYDILMTATSAFYLLKYKLTSTHGSVMSKVVNMMLYDGLGYLIALTGINILNLILYKTSSDIQSAGASLGYCITWIMSQRLLIHLHDASRERRMESDDTAITITQENLSHREISEALRTHLSQKRSGSHSQPVRQYQLRRSDLEQTSDQQHSEDFDVLVRVERTVKVERLSRTVQMEDYSRGVRQPPGRNVRTRS